MDILTHACIGLISAAPFLANRPELGLGLVAGSVLPDIDALSRVFGKKAFLRAHQTWSHAVLPQLAGSITAGLTAGLLGLDGIQLGLGLFVGLAGHSLLDLCNTLGVKLLIPFSQKRYCLEWVFFIDAVVLTSMSITLAFCGRDYIREGEGPGLLVLIFFTFLLAYFLGKGFLRKRAGMLVPAALSLLPSALLPWRFYATCQEENLVKVLQLNAITGKQTSLIQQQLFDTDFVAHLETLAEFQIMREFSPAYHVVGVSSDPKGTYLQCRDLRTRNFGTSFGDLEVWLDPQGRITQKKFHV